MTTIAQIKRTKKFKTLIAVGLDENAALRRLGHEVAAPVDERMTKLLEAGFSEAEALAALGEATPAAPVEAAPVEATPPTSKEIANQVVEDAGFVYTKGCVYVTGDIIEAAVRVRKTGKVEWVASSGIGRTKAVVLYRTDGGDVALQNLTRPASA